jgi:FAD/FMN-containing dehydrogenase/alkanesulfonate monooxygenase SsuD/methylene tetrahydromethanopterin reductase-like flavin-dependent oxidoreductase (luciferase family)
MNYGHPLQAGLLVKTHTSTSESATSLALRAETSGYDLVTLEHDSVESDSFDIWTLATWIAAQTERIQLGVTVTDFPRRMPAVLARSAISLDLLTSGRLNLGLSDHRVPADAVESVIEIVRGMMNVSERRSLSASGYFSIRGAKRGPVPAHDIPVWLHGAGPEMLRLAGERADVWIAPYQNMRAEDLRIANQYIDHAAKDAERDPREIRRGLVLSGMIGTDSAAFLQGAAEQWVSDLLPYVLDHGVGTFLLDSTDRHTVETFAMVVLPALHDAAEREVPHGILTRPVRRADIRAKRHPGIDYEGVPESLRDSAIEPGDVTYPTVRSTYIRAGAPGIVLQPRTTAEVVDALAYARKHPDVFLSVRSAGHGISGRSTNRGGIVIDLSKMNAIELLDESSHRVRLEPGARWMDVAAALAPYGLGLSSGDYGGVGVGGLATAGGIGWLSRKHGLTIDHLKAVQMVLADGSIVRASRDENPDLFWAVRGAGANFGIVTSFEFEAYEVGNIGFGQFVIDAGETAVFLTKWGATIEASPRDLTSFLIMGPPRPGQPMVAQVLTVVASDDPDTIVDRLQPVANIGPLYNQNVMIMPYAALMANAQGSYHDATGEPAARSGLIRRITPDFAQAAAKLINSGAVYFFQIRSVGGAVSDVPPDATAYANRSANFSVTAFGPNVDRVNEAWDELAHHYDGLYLSFETDQRLERLNDAFPGETLEQLRELKRKWDPDNVFQDNFNLAQKVSVS